MSCQIIRNGPPAWVLEERQAAEKKSDPANGSGEVDESSSDHVPEVDSAASASRSVSPPDEKRRSSRQRTATAP